MRRGFLHLVAIIDWFTRKILAWRLSNTLDADLWVDALNEAIAKYGPPSVVYLSMKEKCNLMGRSKK